MNPRTPAFEAALRREFAQHHKFLWGLCYRMTGSACDADDVVQDTFERALRSPPADVTASLRPWLSRIAVNLSCDQLRRRKLVRYRGSWLPEPVPTAELIGDQPAARGADARYDLCESITFAFLIALERLSPVQRAVLLLRDVFDYTVREAAEALELSEANVKTTLHRARAAMAEYDAARCIPTPALRRRTERALQKSMLHLATDNVAAIEALLREDVLARNDPGEFVAACKLVVGREKVAFFHRKITRFVAKRPSFALRDLNGLPAIVFVYEPLRSDFASRQIMRADVDARGRIREIHSVLASRKLGRVRFDGLHKVGALEQLTADGLRHVLAHLQPGARMPSRFVQVHPRSRARKHAR
jgi:RNA polymerase sigma-70 factor (ECF subfamily)